MIKSIDKSILDPTSQVSLHCWRQWRINDFMNPEDRFWCSVSTLRRGYLRQSEGKSEYDKFSLDLTGQFGQEWNLNKYLAPNRDIFF